MLYQKPQVTAMSGFSCMGINAQVLPLKPTTVQLQGFQRPKRAHLSWGIKFSFSTPALPQV